MMSAHPTHRLTPGRTRRYRQLTTVEMFVDTVSEQSFDLLNLIAGDAIRVEFAEGEKEQLASIPSEHDRIAYLVERGYSEGIGTLMAKNVARLPHLKPEFVVRRATVDFQTDGTDGAFEVQINYANRVQIAGNASGAQGWI